MLIQSDSLHIPLADNSVHCVVTSPPYWGLRDYSVDGQIGLESTPEQYVEKMVQVFREVRRVLRDDGTCWVNLGDSYNANQGSGFDTNQNGDINGRKKAAASPKIKWGKPKDLVGIPWRVAFALQADGWWLRSDIIWSKPNPMPESVTDRPTKAHEYIFLLAKSERYFFDQDAVREPLGESAASNLHRLGAVYAGKGRGAYGESGPANGSMAAWTLNPAGRNIRTVWNIATQPYPDAHFATFPEEIAKRCILAGCPVGGTVLDPFAGSGTTVQVAQDLGRIGIGLDLNPKYLQMAKRRTAQLGFGSLL